jgi:biotin carboxyl carrier protein
MKLIVRHEEEEIPVEVVREGSVYSIQIGEKSLNVDCVTANAFLQTLRLEDGRQFLIASHRDQSRYEISFGDRTVQLEVHDPLALRGRRGDEDLAGSGNVTAMMPGRVVKVMVGDGDEVRKGTPLLILEAMKMQNEIQSPRDGTVSKVHVADGQTVESGASLVTIG